MSAFAIKTASCLRTIFALALVAAIPAHAWDLAPPGANEHEQSETGVRATEDHWSLAEMTGQTDWLESMLMPGYRSVDSNGAAHSKERIVAGAAKNKGSTDGKAKLDAYLEGSSLGHLGGRPRHYRRGLVLRPEPWAGQGREVLGCLPVRGRRLARGVFAARHGRQGMRSGSALASACALIALAAPALGCAEDAHALVGKALSAMGQGRDLHTVAQLKRTTTSVDFDIVEFDHADAPFVFSGARGQTTVDDLHGQRRMSDESQLTASGAPPPYVMRKLYGKDGEVGEMVMAGKAALAWHMEAPMAWQTDEPIAALLLAEQADDLKQEKDTSLHGIPQHLVSFHQGKSPVRIYLDAQTNLPSAIETTRSWHRATSGDLAWNAWGDITDRVELMNYALGEGVRYPGQSDTFRNGVHLRAAVIEEVHFDNAVDDNAFAMKSEMPPIAAHNVDDLSPGEAVGLAPDPKKPIAEIAPGVVQIPGSWYSTIVRQDDGLVIIDAPISAGYSRRVLDEAARRFPGMKVKALITSTAFYWHIAGVREYVARGIPIYVRDRNVAVIRALAAAPHGLLPDAPRACTAVAGHPVGIGSHHPGQRCQRHHRDARARR